MLKSFKSIWKHKKMTNVLNALGRTSNTFSIYQNRGSSDICICFLQMGCNVHNINLTFSFSFPAVVSYDRCWYPAVAVSRYRSMKVVAKPPSVPA